MKNKEITIDELAEDLNLNDQRELTNDVIDTMLDLIAGCVDKDVTFHPVDPDGDGPYAADEAEKYLA